MSSALPSDTRGESLAHELKNLELSSRESVGQPRSGLNSRESEATIYSSVTDKNASDKELRDGKTRVSPPRGPSPRRSARRAGPVIHKVEDEELPSDEYHHPNFQRRLTRTSKLLQSLTEVLSSGSAHQEPESIMKGLHERAKDLSSFQPLSTRIVGFVGDSGVGKSSLLNSLLDYRGLARTNNNGAACTCVVTEYHYHDADDFVVEVERFNIEDLHGQLAELLGYYRNFHVHGDGLGDEELRDLEAKAKLAVDTFLAMFRGNLQDEDWLLEESQEIILAQFRAWMARAFGLRLPSRQVATSLDQCSQLLMELTSEVLDAQEPAIWPYIRKVKVFIKAHILSKGLVLVDLPGLRDLNSARANITESNIRNCHEVFAVCNIGRATTDVGVKNAFKLARDVDLEHIGVVCTKSDDINIEEMKNDWEQEHGRQIRSMMKSLRSVERGLKVVDEEIATFQDLPDMEPETQRDLFKFLGDKKKLEEQRNDEDFEMKRYAIETRNAYVVRRLQEAYKRHTKAKTLHTFCISNTMYWEKRMEDKSVAEPLLNLSGIIAIRKHCTAMVSASQLRTSKKFLDSSVPALLSDIDLWVRSGSGSTSAEQKETVRNVLDKIEGQLYKELDSTTSPLAAIGDLLKGNFRRNIWKGIVDLCTREMSEVLNESPARQISKWTEGSTRACLEWDTWHNRIYAAFCLNGGNHTTPKMPHRNWNQEAMCDMVSDLERPWEDLRADCQNQELQVNQLIQSTWDDAMSILESEWPSSDTSKIEVCQAMRSREHLLIEAMEDVFDMFDRNISKLEIDALSGVNTSMFGAVMSRVYSEAARQYGPGSDRRRKDIVANTLTDKDTFRNFMQDFKERLNLRADDLQQVLSETISMHLDGVRATLDLVRQENVAEESERDPDFRNRVAAEVARVRGMMST